jgi:undecaprenyl-diphosphatase
MKSRKLLEEDARISNRLRIAENPGALRTFAMVFAHSGDSWFWGVGILLVWLISNPYWQERAILFGASVLVTALLVLTIKFTVKRRRPEGEWGEIYRSTDPHSFPSGHAARAFMLAVLTMAVGPSWFGLILLIWAPLVGLARVAMGVHYVSDVIAGALIGIFMGWINASLMPLVISYVADLL